MSSNKLTDTLDSLSDKAFVLKDKHPGSHTDASETVPAAAPEDKTETLNTAHAPTSIYPVVEQPTAKFQSEDFEPETDAASEQERHIPETTSPDGGSSVIIPEPPVNPPTQGDQGHKPELKTGPQQNFTVATIAGFMGILCLFLMFTHEALGLIAVGFGATAVYFARKTERAGTDAGIGKTLGYISFFGGIIATIIEAFVLFIVFLFLALVR